MSIKNFVLISIISCSVGITLQIHADEPKTSDSNKKKETMKTTGDKELQLTPLQRHVTLECGTEPAFRNEYWDNKKPGIYVSIISGKPLFASVDKFDSGTGWPSFTKPIDKTAIEEKTDKTHGVVRTEVRSKTDNSHLGHVFDDGPGPEGLRYCINSASLRFIPVEKLEEEGYGEYLKLFKQEKKEENKQ